MWHERAVVVGLLLVGMVHLVPAMVVFAPGRLPTAYGVAVDGPDLELLLRHRAVLLGLVGAACVAAAFSPPLRGAVVVGALLSVTSFAVLAITTVGTGTETGRVARVDVGATAVLLAVGALLSTAPAST